MKTLTSSMLARLEYEGAYRTYRIYRHTSPYPANFTPWSPSFSLSFWTWERLNFPHRSEHIEQAFEQADHLRGSHWTHFVAPRSPMRFIDFYKGWGQK